MIAGPLRDALLERLLAQGDDELVLAHRNSEWTGHAPILEEDIAFANIALDELGHASIWYGLRTKLTGEDVDRLVFFRGPGDYRNVQMVELPRGDWAFSMARQYLFDTYEVAALEQLRGSAYGPLAEAAAKIATEEIYHVRHTQLWMRRLGLGTDESHGRLQQAVDSLWPHARQLFTPLPGDAALVDAGILPPAALIRAEWEAQARPFLGECGLVLSDEALPRRDVPRTEHTEHLMVLLSEMQSVARMDPTAEW
jgi:ring-1,2-phenylacetyl-CoA epoxidase subunit PaaC